jgi:hypothetical protein
MKSSKTLKFDLSVTEKSVLNTGPRCGSVPSTGTETSYRPWNAAFVPCGTPVVVPAKRS